MPTKTALAQSSVVVFVAVYVGVYTEVYTAGPVDQLARRDADVNTSVQYPIDTAARCKVDVSVQLAPGLA